MPQGRKHQRPNGQVGDVVVVHHVEVDDVRPSGQHGADLLPEAGEVRGQNGGRNPRLHGVSVKLRSGADGPIVAAFRWASL